ncbi:MAG: phosphatidylglycerol lysyltransferase domain-containing protein [Acholeplasmatales bacterium]|jgi:hypothetical protein|nr:phosphatidylglycerol lysyltransferase domain-containing protein [Acholeplasmatales bacterium]
MINFRVLSKLDKDKINSFTSKKILKDTSVFYSLYAWKDYNSTNIYISDNYIIYMHLNENKEYYFTYTINDDKYIKEIIEEVENYCKYSKILPKFLDIEKYELPFFSSYNIEDDLDSYDYIFNVEDLAFFKGKKYHSKRNFVAQFNKDYECNVVQYDKTKYEEVINFYYYWSKDKEGDLHNEINCIRNILDIYDKSDILILLFYSNNKLIGFSFSDISINMPSIMFEKGDAEYIGVNQFIFSKTASFLNRYKYVSLENDMGLLNLRQTKLSYHPFLVLKKYICTKK